MPSVFGEPAYLAERGSMTPEELLGKLVAECPIDRVAGGVSCAYCYAMLDLKRQHEPDCPWDQARKYVNSLGTLTIA